MEALLSCSLDDVRIVNHLRYDLLKRFHFGDFFHPEPPCDDLRQHTYRRADLRSSAIIGQ